MAKMSLGGYTMTQNPSDMEVITPQRYASDVKTYSSVAFFSWGTTIVGHKVQLHFNYLPVAQYSQFMTLLEADATVVWDPQDGGSTTYNVEITSLRGEYDILLDTGDRKNATLELLILSEVA
jgi:hypothetical protein